MCLSSARTGRRQLLIDGPVIPYSTHGLMGFSIDVDVGRLGAKLSGTRPKAIAQQIMDSLSDCMIGYDGKPLKDGENSMQSERDRERENDERRDAEIRRMLMNGATFKEIGRELHVSPRIISRVSKDIRYGGYER